MESPLYTEEDFKKLLRELLADKKREADTQASFQKKFFSKLAGNKLIEEEVSVEKKQEIEVLKKQLDKVRPALKKLVDDLKAAKEEVAVLKKTTVSLEEFSEKESQLNKETEDKKLLYDQVQILQKKLFSCEEELKLLNQERAQNKTSLYQEEIQRLQLELSQEYTRRENQISQLEKEKQQFQKELNEKELELQKRKESEKEVHRFDEERQRLIEKLADSLSQIQRQNEMIAILREEASHFKREFDVLEERCRKAELETEESKGKLSQSIFDSTKNYSSLEKQLQEEIKRKEELKIRLDKALEELAEEKGAVSFQMEEWEKKENEACILRKQLEVAQEEIKKRRQENVIEEYEARIIELKEKFQAELIQKSQGFEDISQDLKSALTLSTQKNEALQHVLAQKEGTFEEVLSRGYVKMRELSQKHGVLIEENHRLEKALEEAAKRVKKIEHEMFALQTGCQNLKVQCEEKDAEIRKAQQHLAKKVKESTILQDLLERQKNHSVEVQKEAAQCKGEIERLQSHLNILRLQEEKQQTLTKEKIHASERLVKEWQEKYASLSHEFQNLKNHLIELQRVKKQHDVLFSTVTTLKQLLSKTEVELNEKTAKEEITSRTTLDDFFDQ